MRLSTLIFAPVLVLGLSAARAASLPDTGQTLCYDGSNVLAVCSNANAGDTATYPRQDGRFGRDAQAAKGTLPKIGAGAAGFDYTKVANNGADVAAGTALGAGATDWACTRDNITGLLWEVKTSTATDLRAASHQYTWYSTNGATNGGNVGTNAVTNSCGTPPTLASCNTEAFIAAVNAASGLCGYKDWRLPSLRELKTIVHYGASNLAIDTTYFPNTSAFNFWSASTYVLAPSDAWGIVFSDGGNNHYAKTGSTIARLVRGLQF